MLGNGAAAERARARHAAYRNVDAPNERVTSQRAPSRHVPGTHGFQHLGNYQVLGGPVIAVRIATDDDIEPLRHILAALATQISADQRFDYELTQDGQHRLCIDGRIVMEGDPSEEQPGQDLRPNPLVYVLFELLLRLLSHIPLLAILHGSAVVWRGKRIVFVGGSGSGKSTLAASLAGSGEATYLGDDVVAITRSRDIVPVALAPSIKQGTWPIALAHFPQLAEASVFNKGTRPLKYLVDAPFAKQGGPPDLIVFPTFSQARDPKSVRLTEIEVLLQISQAGLWVTLENLDPLLDMLGGLPAIALRHGPDLDQTHAMLAGHLWA